MSVPLIECVPNFSEGRDPAVIKAITDQIESVEGVRLLDADMGRAANRTVVTFVGEPEAVVEAAFRAIRTAAERIDMRRHHGEHPRLGATDVCPLVPIAGITMEETVEAARRLAERVGRELGIPVYLYEHAATSPERRNLATIRAGEYEGLAEKLARPEWQPDFGPPSFSARSGATVIGARDLLVAYNVNLNTTSSRRATAVAFDVREQGRMKRIGHPVTGEIARDEEGQPVWIPGSLKAVKAIGWVIEDYGIAQVSMNLTNLSVTPVHVAFDEVCRRAEARGLRVTGSELVGLIPLQALLDAGRHYLRQQQRSLGIAEEEIIDIAVRTLGLSELAPFDPRQKVIEYRLRDETAPKLVDRDLRAFANVVASEAPAPGGGSVAACVAALGAALGTMVANLSAHKPGPSWEGRWAQFSEWAERGQAHKEALLRLVDEDAGAFNALMAAHRLPKSTQAERTARAEAVQTATRAAIEAPLAVMREAVASTALLRAMAAEGSPSSVSDAGVGVLCARAAVRAAFLNVRINLPGITDPEFAAAALAQGQQLLAQAEAEEAEILRLVDGALEAPGGE